MKIATIPAPANLIRLMPHPIAMEFPEIDADTFQDLCASMRKHGYDAEHPIVLFNGMILDGRNRIRAVKEINARCKPEDRITPAIVRFDGTHEEAVSFSIRENLLRRHLTAGQRALIGDGLANISHGGDRRSADQTASLQSGSSERIRDAAEKVHVAPRTVHYARQLKSIDPEAAKRVKDGKESLNGALRKAKAKQPKPEPEAVELDDEGREIHPLARQSLTDGRERFRKITNTLHAVGRDIKTLCQTPDGRLMDWTAIKVDLDNLLRVARYCAPYTSCPLGDPCDEDCKLCRGSQWVGESQWEHVPKEVKNGHGRSASAGR